MPRTARMDYPGALHHVVVRGIERRDIFLDEEDRRRFLVRLEETLVAAETPCLAWAQMSNHVHLLLETAGTPLSAIMRRLGTCYAMDFNRRHDRAGHLFQNRYFSKLVEDDGYALIAIRYVHLNPVRAGVVPSPEALEEYPWTGHRALMGHCRNRFQDVAGVLAMLHDDPTRARRMLRSLMATDADPPGGGPAPPSGAPGGPPGAAVVPFLGLLPTPAPAHPPPSAPPPAPRGSAEVLRLQGWDLDRLIRRVAALTGVAEEDLRSGRRHRAVSRARALVAHFGREDLGLPLETLGRGLGIGGTGIAGAIARGKVLASAGGWRFPP